MYHIRAVFAEMRQLRKKAPLSSSLALITASLGQLESAPPTIQRICELLQRPPGAPMATYDTYDKYLFALEKVPSSQRCAP